MINKNFFERLRKDYGKNGEERRKIVIAANSILHDSKRIIFSLHRSDLKGAEATLKSVEKSLAELEKKFGFSRLNSEGSYRAAAEEYVEARMFFKFLNKEKIDKISGPELETDVLLAGICDFTGELVRLAINEAAAGRIERVREIKEEIEEIMSALVELDMTGYLRTKYDQAKMNIRKIEQISYEVALRK